MAGSMAIRDSRQGDMAALQALYPDAFPDEDLLPLVRALMQDTALLLSLVVEVNGTLAGHVACTACRVVDAAGESGEPAALLGPLAVASSQQRQGIGSALVRAGLHRLDGTGIGRVFVLGNPAYYGRFGFESEDFVAPPYALPDHWLPAWQSMSPGSAVSHRPGRLVVSASWRDPRLWSP